jgi:UDP-glucose-4-epimerase GalE
VRGDLADGDALTAVLGSYKIEAVLHFAANACVEESVRLPRIYFQNNVVNTLNLLDVMLDNGISRIVFSSTCATYGEPIRIPITDDHPKCPVNPYGESKLFIEKVLDWYGKAYGLEWLALRYFNVAGADPEGEIGEVHDPETHLVPITIQAAVGLRAHLEIYGTDYDTADGSAIRDYVHVTDLADAHVRALEYLLGGGGSMSLNLGSGTGCSVREIIRAVEKTTGRRVPVRNAPRRAGDPAVLLADAGQAIEKLDWARPYSTTEAIVETAWRWHNTL